jgi:hypothetical protein
MMPTFTVHQGKRYRATIVLGWMERWATNAAIAAKLRSAGFMDVMVEGSGGLRTAEGLWAFPDATAELPAQVSDVTAV